MSELENKTRREFLRKAGGLTVGTAVTVPVLGSTILGTVFGTAYMTGAMEVEKSTHKPGIILKKTIAETPYTLYGVTHSKGFVKEYRSTMEKLVKESSAMVMERSTATRALNRGVSPYDDGDYFETMILLCEKYGKPLITLDSLSIPGLLVETGLGIGGALYAGKHSYQILTRENTRRESMKAVVKTGLGTYFFLSSLFSSLFLKGLTKMEIEGSEDISIAEGEQWYLGHVTDQRNLQLLDRLERLPKLLKKEGVKEGNVLVTFGRAHIEGVEYYLKNPTMRSIKSAMHGISYDLIDNNEVALYIPQNGSWKKKRLD